MRRQDVHINKIQGFDADYASTFNDHAKNIKAKTKLNIKVKIGLSILTIVIAVVLYGVYLFNKPMESIVGMKADFIISATELQAAYEADEKASDKKYLGKVVEVTGTLQSINKDSKGNISLLLDTDNPISAVSCSLDLKSMVLTPLIQPGQKVVIKGFCSGYLSDVVLVRCVFAK